MHSIYASSSICVLEVVRYDTSSWKFISSPIATGASVFNGHNWAAMFSLQRTYTVSEGMLRDDHYLNQLTKDRDAMLVVPKTWCTDDVDGEGLPGKLWNRMRWDSAKQ